MLSAFVIDAEMMFDGLDAQACKTQASKTSYTMPERIRHE
jgi:hypothetical protein